MPMRRVTRSVTEPRLLAIGAGVAVLVELGAVQRAHDAIVMRAERELHLHLDPVARGGARGGGCVSRLPRAAGIPYIAQAIASSRVVFPAPFGPMMPVRPAPELELGVLVLAEVHAGGGD